MIEKDTRRYGQDAETRKMSHTVSVQKDTLVLEMDIKKTNGSGPGWKRGKGNPAVCASLRME